MMDLGTFLSIVALMLAIPLAVIGNLITPYIKDIYFKRNEKSAIKRIKKLEKEGKELKILNNDYRKLIAKGFLLIFKIISFGLLSYIGLIVLNIYSETFSIFETKSYTTLITLYKLCSVYLILFLLLKEIVLFKNVLNYEGYEKKVDEVLNKLKQKNVQTSKLNQSNHLIQTHSPYFFIFYANALNKNFGDIWDSLEEGSYSSTFLSTENSKESIDFLISAKRIGELSSIKILGLYYNDDPSKTAKIIELLDIDYNNNILKFRFRKVEDTHINSESILNKIEDKNMYSFNSKPQFINKVNNNLNDFLRHFKIKEK